MAHASELYLGIRGEPTSEDHSDILTARYAHILKKINQEEGPFSDWSFEGDWFPGADPNIASLRGPDGLIRYYLTQMVPRIHGHGNPDPLLIAKVAPTLDELRNKPWERVLVDFDQETSPVIGEGEDQLVYNTDIWAPEMDQETILPGSPDEQQLIRLGIPPNAYSEVTVVDAAVAANHVNSTHDLAVFVASSPTGRYAFYNFLQYPGERTWGIDMERFTFRDSYNRLHRGAVWSGWPAPDSGFPQVLYGGWMSGIARIDEKRTLATPDCAPIYKRCPEAERLLEGPQAVYKDGELIGFHASSGPSWKLTDRVSYDPLFFPYTGGSAGDPLDPRYFDSPRRLIDKLGGWGHGEFHQLHEAGGVFVGHRKTTTLDKWRDRVIASRLYVYQEKDGIVVPELVFFDGGQFRSMAAPQEVVSVPRDLVETTYGYLYETPAEADYRHMVTVR